MTARVDFHDPIVGPGNGKLSITLNARHIDLPDFPKTPPLMSPESGIAADPLRSVDTHPLLPFQVLDLSEPLVQYASASLSRPRIDMQAEWEDESQNRSALLYGSSGNKENACRRLDTAREQFFIRSTPYSGSTPISSLIKPQKYPPSSSLSSSFYLYRVHMLCFHLPYLLHLHHQPVATCKDAVNASARRSSPPAKSSAPSRR